MESLTRVGSGMGREPGWIKGKDRASFVANDN